MTEAEQEVINRALVWCNIERMEKHLGPAPSRVKTEALAKLSDAVDALDKERAQSVGAEFIAAVRRLDESPEIIKAVMSGFGRRGGASKSEAKKQAVKKNLAEARKKRWPKERRTPVP